jgi:hypothetical protein
LNVRLQVGADALKMIDAVAENMRETARLNFEVDAAQL